MEQHSEIKHLHTGRLEAFSDGVLAIILTIMVLELHVPHETSFAALQALWPTFLSYLLSFIYVGIYWNNHHHMFAVTQRVSGGILWANLHLLFWLSLIPFVTGWLGENHYAPLPAACYGIVLLMASVAYRILQRTILKEPENQSLLIKALGADLKGRLSPLFYAIGAGTAFFSVLLSCAIYAAVALMWLIPDKRIERAIKKTESDLA